MVSGDGDEDGDEDQVQVGYGYGYADEGSLHHVISTHRLTGRGEQGPDEEQGEQPRHR